MMHIPHFPLVFTARIFAILIIGVLSLSIVGNATAQFTLSVEEPYQGEPVKITLPQPADTLTITYRPSSSIPHVEHIMTGGATTVDWTPSRAGVVAVSLPGGPSQNLSVRYRSLPILGLIVLILAGSILFGGAAFSFRKLFQADTPLLDPTLRPDT